ncbi:LysR family transcriptional regulator [Rhodoferax sp.]|uniref:LysR family transcriptional regulator n=1 Tax=Rhodoferax sp. TaxID=50421 RepID=UPI002ACE0BE0|nr:LysR family transcriptional regulator [Rhodoferax sp.]MDZ7921219.1 LysR family transcriptional regulator [Rhodoferax sp.]
MHSVNVMETKKPAIPRAALTTALDADALELFARVARAGSFSLAAQQVGQTRAAVSRRIAYMEQRTGQTLFLRTTRSLTLTATGRRLLPHAMAVLDAVAQARGTLTSVHAGLAGSLRITSLPSFGTTVLPPLLLKFRALHPGVNYDLILSDRRVDLQREGVDIAFRVTRKPPPDWVARPYLQFHVGAFCAPGQWAPMVHPEELAPAPLLLLGPVSMNPEMRWVRRDGTDAVLCARAPAAGQSDDLAVLMRLAEGGMGVVLAPSYCVQDALAAGRLVELLPDWDLDIRQGNTVQLLTLPRPQLSAVARAFAKFVQEQAPATHA